MLLIYCISNAGVVIEHTYVSALSSWVNHSFLKDSEWSLKTYAIILKSGVCHVSQSFISASGVLSLLRNVVGFSPG